MDYIQQRFGIGGTTLASETKVLGAGASNGAVTGNAKFLEADNPVLWLFGVAAVTLGLIGINGSLRVGPFKASASAGK